MFDKIFKVALLIGIIFLCTYTVLIYKKEEKKIINQCETMLTDSFFVGTDVLLNMAELEEMIEMWKARKLNK